MAIQFGAGEQVIKIWHWESIQHEVDFSNTSSSISQTENFLSTEYDNLSISGVESLDEKADLEHISATAQDYEEADLLTKAYAVGATSDSSRMLPLVPL